MSVAAFGITLAIALPLEAAPIDDVRSAVGAPLEAADPSLVAGAVQRVIIALPPQDLEQAIDLVGAVAEDVGDREAVAEIAGVAQKAVDTVARENPDEVEDWWSSIIKESILTVVEEKLAAAEQGAEADAPSAPADPFSGADLPLVTAREFAEPAEQPPAPATPPTPRAPEASPARAPEPPPEPVPEVVAEPAPEPERRITVRPVTREAARQANRAPVQLAAPPRTLDQQLADKLAAESDLPPPTPLEDEIKTAAELLRSQGREITTETLNQAMIELAGDCAPLDLEALRAAARYGRCRDVLTQRLAGVTPAAGENPGQTATAPPLDDRQAFRDMVRGYASGGSRP
ncbi:MAG TPA: hypothetical protein VFO41_09505 [Alphaproteobacteria bacterium]|nr:hypothetical protein [Alphaproteobacteria bacterium]